MLLSDRVCAVALRELEMGVKEATGANDGLPSERYMGHRREPWCAWFVAFCFREAGTPLPGDLGTPDGRPSPLASAHYTKGLFDRLGWLRKMPMRGDVVFFEHRMRSDPSKSGWHCGVVERVTVSSVTTIEGNSGDSVSRRTYRTATMQPCWFGRVPEPKEPA